MQCITASLQPIAMPWLWSVAQPVVSGPYVATHNAAKGLSAEVRAEYGKEAAETLNCLTARLANGFTPMKNGGDKSQAWKAKVYVNITSEDMWAQITGPLGSRDERSVTKFVIKAGHAVVAAVVKLQGTDTLRFPRNFAAPKHGGTRGVVFVGVCDYAPGAMPTSLGDKPSCVTRSKSRAKVQRHHMSDLNSAYTQIADDAFADMKELIDIHSDEEQDIYSMKPAKRRKVQLAFNLLSKCDDAIQELAKGVADDIEEEAEPKAPPARRPQLSFEDQLAQSGKCVCGATTTQDDTAHGKKVVGGKKVVVHDNWDKWDKTGKCDKGKKACLRM